jgi:hypothetical protein
MPITIDQPTAEAIYAALQQVPANEIARLREMLQQPVSETPDEEEAAWRRAASASASRFFVDEEER